VRHRLRPAAYPLARPPVGALARLGQTIGKSHALFLLPALVYLAAFALYPLVQLVKMSLAQVTSANLFAPSWPPAGLSNFASIVTSQGFRPATQNTLTFVAVILIVGEGGGLTAALLLHRSGRFGGIVLGTLVFAWALPPVVVGALWKFLLSDTGAVNTLVIHLGGPAVDWLIDRHTALLAVALVNAWSSLPFSALIFRAALLEIPSELTDAAAVDGARPWRILRHITLPLLRPTALVLAILVIVYAFRSFDFIFVMTSGGPGTITTTLPFLSYWLTFTTYDFSHGAATGVITVLIILGLALVYTRAAIREERA
jgi:multiple sugar transport system permease protein